MRVVLRVLTEAACSNLYTDFSLAVLLCLVFVQLSDVSSQELSNVLVVKNEDSFLTPGQVTFPVLLSVIFWRHKE